MFNESNYEHGKYLYKRPEGTKYMFEIFQKYYMYCYINAFKRFWKGLMTANFLPRCKENYLTKSV